MRAIMARSLIWGSFVVAVVIACARPSPAANCVLYVRAQTGVALYGSAGGWWDQADGRYQRGHVPATGAILVFKRTRHSPSGHVALVTSVISTHEILVDQANWYRGTVSHGMSVIDTSPGHDWTTVAVIDLPSGKYGRDNPTYGFVYPGTADASVAGEPGPGFVNLAVLTEDNPGKTDAASAWKVHRHHRAAARLVRKAPSAGAAGSHHARARPDRA